MRLEGRTQAIGRRGEQLALAYLKKRGLLRLEANYRCRGGEIDLVMRDGRVICFVEVRYRGGSQFGDGLDSVDRHKQRRIRHAARHFLSRHPELAGYFCRFDVIAITGRFWARITWVKHAFEAKA